MSPVTWSAEPKWDVANHRNVLKFDKKIPEENVTNHNLQQLYQKARQF